MQHQKATIEPANPQPQPVSDNLLPDRSYLANLYPAIKKEEKPLDTEFLPTFAIKSLLQSAVLLTIPYAITFVWIDYLRYDLFWQVIPLIVTQLFLVSGLCIAIIVLTTRSVKKRLEALYYNDTTYLWSFFTLSIPVIGILYAVLHMFSFGRAVFPFLFVAIEMLLFLLIGYFLAKTRRKTT